MRLDRTRLVIRERDLWEIVDLSLLVVRKYWQPLFTASCVLLLPLTAINLFLLWPLFPGYRDADNVDNLVRFSLAMACLSSIQAPLATAGGTMYLGLDVFYRRLSLGELVRELSRLAGRLLWKVGLLRLVIPSWVLAWMIRSDQSYSAAESWLMLLTVVAWCLRGFQPFLVEVLLLERESGSKLSKRLRTIRNFGQSDGLSRQMALSIPLMYVALSLATMLWIVGRVLLGTNQYDLPLFAGSWTLCLGIVTIFSMVVSYLSYLDLRIRREGWELSLLLGAAAKATEATS